MIKVGIIGAGRIGRVHSESITKYVKGAEIKAISDVRVTDELKQWAKGMGIAHVYEDYKQILQDPEIDAVLVCSSTNTHAPILLKLLEQASTFSAKNLLMQMSIASKRCWLKWRKLA